MDKGSGSGIFPDPDPGDPKRPDSTESGSATLKINKRLLIDPNVSLNFKFKF